MTKINSRGQVFVLVLVVLGLVVVNALVIIAGTLNLSQGTKYSSDQLKALNLAEAGIDKAIAALNSSGGTYTGEGQTTQGVVFGSGAYDVTVSSEGLNSLVITATGYIPNKIKPKVTRNIQVKTSKGAGQSFFYALQVGEGGLVMGNNSIITGVGGQSGSVYSNGNITMDSGSKITGEVAVAGGVAPTPDQTNLCAEQIFQTTTPLPQPLAEHASVSYNGYIYVIGGRNSSGMKNTVYFAPINANGTIGGWATTSPLPQVRYGHTATRVNGYIYVTGGRDSSPQPWNTVYHAQINANGTLGSWNTTSITIPGAKSHHSAVAHASRVRYSGGADFNGNTSNRVFYGHANPSTGLITAWGGLTAGDLPDPLQNHDSVVINNYVYVIGGRNATTAQNIVRYSLVAPTGANYPWVTNSATNLPEARLEHAATTIGNQIFVLGGYSDLGFTNIKSNVYTSTAAADGSLTPFTSPSYSLPQARGFHSAVSYNNYIYAIGGYSSGQTNPADTVYYFGVGNDCQVYNFGKDVGGEERIDVAQSFRPQTSGSLRKVSLKLAKIGNPQDITVKILGDSSGLPNKDQVLSSATLKSFLVTSVPQFIDVALDPPPTLTVGNKYWIVIDASSDANNYWNWSALSGDLYASGEAKYSPDWLASSPVWNNASFPDFAFKTFMGGTITKIEGISAANKGVIGDVSLSGVGNAYANTITNVNIVEGDAYFQTENNILVRGSSCISNPYCHPGSSDPASQIFPISSGRISDWKSIAAGNGAYTSPTTCPSVSGGNTAITLESGKYTGSLDLGTINNCTIFAKTPIWITGNLDLKNGNTLKIDSSIGNQSGYFIVDGTVNLGTGNTLSGNGNPNSYLVLISDYDSSSNAIAAINTGNGLIATKTILYTNLGLIQINNNSNTTAVYGWKINLGQNVQIAYEEGLQNVFLVTAPGGTYSVIKGTYQQP